MYHVNNEKLSHVTTTYFQNIITYSFTKETEHCNNIMSICVGVCVGVLLFSVTLYGQKWKRIDTNVKIDIWQEVFNLQTY